MGGGGRRGLAFPTLNPALWNLPYLSLLHAIDLASDLPVSDKYLSSFGDWALMAASEHSRLEAALPAAVRDDAAALAT